MSDIKDTIVDETVDEVIVEDTQVEATAESRFERIYNGLQSPMSQKKVDGISRGQSSSLIRLPEPKCPSGYSHLNRRALLFGPPIR